MSEGGSPVPPPYVLDSSVLKAIARGDTRAAQAILNLDAMGRPLVVPVLAVTAALLDAHSPDAESALRGLHRLGNVEGAPLRDAPQALRLAAVIARTDLDAWDAHAAAVADASVCWILTLDAAKWRQHLHDLDDPLHIVEIADPGDG